MSAAYTIRRDHGMKHYAWHRESDGETFWIALDSESAVISAYAASELVPPGTVIEWDPCNELEQMTRDMAAGGWHAMGGEPVDWPCSLGPPQ